MAGLKALHTASHVFSIWLMRPPLRLKVNEAMPAVFLE